ncbi:hypothetical protein GCM10022237_42420 [Nocardioides ginsengisoli]|uniref:Uncharacterized protein n=1 Tax=Nocardioides ginsengisoli TaxID=363868 RepID=A0ABW3VV27_9ACTN
MIIADRRARGISYVKDAVPVAAGRCALALQLPDRSARTVVVPFVADDGAAAAFAGRCHALAVRIDAPDPARPLLWRFSCIVTGRLGPRRLRLSAGTALGLVRAGTHAILVGVDALATAEG